jgi:hypothetical protein
MYSMYPISHCAPIPLLARILQCIEMVTLAIWLQCWTEYIGDIGDTLEQTKRDYLTTNIQLRADLLDQLNDTYGSFPAGPPVTRCCPDGSATSPPPHHAALSQEKK